MTRYIHTFREHGPLSWKIGVEREYGDYCKENDIKGRECCEAFAQVLQGTKQHQQANLPQRNGCCSKHKIIQTDASVIWAGHDPDR